MKQIVALCALACMLSNTAFAQKTYNTRSQCMRNCAEVGPSDAKREAYQRKIAELDRKKNAETDPKKLALLKDEEESVIDKYEADSEKLCRYICDGMPEQ
ncbi:hypothetical protein [Massilia timonae]|uniref:hypothetical protein n=1 Tax=Massilia timonae TaxID=47229 RepID=UPI0028D3098D|nr:hypothetical protein [Massilia timonae]